jgi:hypothetical protein
MFRRYLYQRDYRRKQKAEKRRLREHHKAMRQEIRSELRKERKIRLITLLSNPFAAKALTPEQKLRRDMRKYSLQTRQQERDKWIQRFKHHPFRTLFIREKSEEQIQMEQWRKVDRKIAFRKRLRGSFLALADILKTPDLRNRFTISLLQSTTYFILSFLLVYIIYQLVTIAVAQSFNIPTIWYYYRVKFPLFSGSQLYTRSALISIFASGPVFSLGLAFVFLKLYFNRRITNQNLKLFYLWGFINGVNMFFGSYIAGFITRTEFIYASEWIFMSSMFDVEEIVFTFIAITILLLIGRLVTPLFLLTSGSATLISPKFRLYYILSRIFIPWAIGVMIFFLMTNPIHYLPLTIKTLTPVFVLITSLFTYNSIRNHNIHTTGVIRKNYFRWSIIIAVIALIFFYRILLNIGLQFF